MMTTKNHNREFVKYLRELVGNTIFSCHFKKRTTGEDRVMLCRFGVRHNLKGGPERYDPVDRGLIRVYDMQHDGYRMIPMEGIKSLTIRGTTTIF